MVTNSDKKAKVIINAQQKGGVGKTTDTVMEAVVAATIFDRKVLVIDTDLQANATSFLAKSFGITELPKTLMRALEEGNLQSAIVKLNNNLSMIPSGYDMRRYGDFLIESFDNLEDQTFYMKKLIEPLKVDFDYIFIDVPPSTDLKVDNAMVAADYVIVVQETQQFSFEGSQRLVYEYLQVLSDDFGDKITTQAIGILPVLLQKRRALHQKIVEQTIEQFGRDYVFNTVINNHARLEYYPRIGIQFDDIHDKKMFALFADIFNELEQRIALYEATNDTKDFKYKHIFINDNKLTDKGKELYTNAFDK